MDDPFDLQLTETALTNITISGGNFWSVAGDFHTHYTTHPPLPDDRGLQILLQNIASEALFDSAELSRVSVCHPNTRARIQEKILDWVGDTNSQHSVFWLHGRVGEGKTAVLRSVAYSLSPYDLGDIPTFFFGRGKGKREQARYLFPTLAHQLIRRMPDLRPLMNDIMLEKPSLPWSSLGSQFQSLFVDAFRRLQDLEGIPLPSPQIILIDGLDECNSERDQQMILTLIGELVTVHALPLRFVVASRPEPHIREIFEGDHLRNITLQTAISEDPASLHDIETFLRQELGEIYKRKAHLVDGFPGSHWPPEDIIKTLVTKSSGQFIYASTVVQFVDDRFSRPDDQLKVILSLRSSERKVFSALDSLYMEILSVYPDDRIEAVKRVLEFVVALSRSSAGLLEDLLQLRHGEVELLLGGLHSILSGITPRKKLRKHSSHRRSMSDLDLGDDLRSWADFISSMRFSNARPAFFSAYDPDLDIIHASFIDFLLDPSRSGPYFIDTKESDIRVVTAIFTMMSSLILNSLHGNPQRSFSIDTVISTEIILFPHLARLPSLPLRVLDDIFEIEESFRKADRRSKSSIPVESFVGIHLFIMAAIKEMRNNSPEYKNQLVNLNNRYLKLLFLWSDDKIRELNHVGGVLVIQDDLPAEALADLFMIELRLVEEYWKGQGLDIKICRGQSILVQSLKCLSILDQGIEENKALCKRAERGHLDLCRRLVLRFLDKSSLNRPRPPVEILRYMESFLTVHLDGLILIASEMESALQYLDIFNEYLGNAYETTMSPDMLIGVWLLIKATLTWLSKLDKRIETRSNSSSVSQRLTAEYNHLCGMIFCVKRSESAQNEITIRQPFLEIENSLMGSKSKYFPTLWGRTFRTSNREPEIASSLIFDTVEEILAPSCLSSDLFLLNLTDLKLDSYFTDAACSGDLYLSSDKFYFSIFSSLRELLSINDESYDPFRETKRRTLVKACAQYLQYARSCDGWIEKCRPDWRGSGENEERKCPILDWCDFIQKALKFLPSYYLYNLEKRKVEDIIQGHRHSSAEGQLSTGNECKNSSSDT